MGSFLNPSERDRLPALAFGLFGIAVGVVVALIAGRHANDAQLILLALPPTFVLLPPVLLSLPGFRSQRAADATGKRRHVLWTLSGYLAGSLTMLVFASLVGLPWPSLLTSLAVLAAPPAAFLVFNKRKGH